MPYFQLKRYEPLVHGYLVKWQPANRISESSAAEPRDLGEYPSWLNVTDPRITTAVVANLHPYTTYKFFLVPWFNDRVFGQPSNMLDGTTRESGPSAPPQDVRVRMMNLTTLRISWRPPPSERINGLLKGYHIAVKGNDSLHSRNISTHDRAASVILYHLIPGMTYRVQVAAFTAGGVGDFHQVDVVTMGTLN